MEERIARLDHLIIERPDGHRGLGLRLALGMAQEMRDGLPPGARTQDLVLEWQKTYPEEWVEEAVAAARIFLQKPDWVAREVSGRLPEGMLASTEEDFT